MSRTIDVESKLRDLATKMEDLAARMKAHATERELRFQSGAPLTIERDDAEDWPCLVIQQDHDEGSETLSISDRDDAERLREALVDLLDAMDAAEQ